MATSLELRHERANLWERVKEIVDGAESETRNLTTEEEANYHKLDAEIRALDERISRAERVESAPATEPTGVTPIAIPSNGSADPRSPEERATFEKAAFRHFLKHGFRGMPDEQRSWMESRSADMPVETRALSVGLDTAGGYLVPDEYRRQIESAMLWYGGMRQSGATMLQTTTGADIPIPTDNDTTNTGELVGENQAVTEQDITVGQRVLRAYFYSSKMIRVPFSLLQDSAFDIEAWLRDKLAERIGRAQNLHFTTGAGPDRPTGIATDAVNGKTAAATGAVLWDELIDLEHSVDRAYRERARWMLNDTTLRDIRKLKDGEARYLWQPGVAVGAPNTLMGYPYVVNSDMPSMATGVKAILFGDFSKYIIRDVVGFSLLVLRERYAENLQVAFIGYSRADGKLLDAGTNPVKCITMA